MEKPSAAIDITMSHQLSFEEVTTFFELSLDLIILSDRQGSIRYINPAWEKSLGWTRAEILEQPFIELIHPDDRERSRRVFEMSFQGQEHAYFENRYRGKDGIYRTLLWTVPAVPPHSQLSYASARDRTERRRTDDLLRESEERYRIVVENSGQLIYDYDVATGRIIWMGAIEQITGYSPQEFGQMNIDQWADHLHPDDREQAVRLLDEAMHSRTQYLVRYRFRHKLGHYLHISDTGLFISSGENQAHRMLGTMSDVTPVVTYEQSLRESEAQLRSSLRDKEVLLREIHHRVKNNLQIISSLLNLQASQLDEQTRELFRESRERIRSMALIHEQLYSSDNFASIRVAEYMRQLTTNLSRSYGRDTTAVAVDIAPDITIDIDLAIPCGLIVNELVSNAMKYAFVDRTSGLISVGFTSDPTGCTLSVADNGCGLPESITPATVRTLGLQLVDTLVNQIGGTMSIDRTHGTAFTIVRPLAHLPATTSERDSS